MTALNHNRLLGKRDLKSKPSLLTSCIFSEKGGADLFWKPRVVRLFQNPTIHYLILKQHFTLKNACNNTFIYTENQAGVYSNPLIIKDNYSANCYC